MSDDVIPLHAIEIILAENGDHGPLSGYIARLRVAGGWLYMNLKYSPQNGNVAVAQTFVPDIPA